MTTIAERKNQILKLIAEGYFERCENDRFIICSNPDYDGMGGDTHVVFDILDEFMDYRDEASA